MGKDGKPVPYGAGDYSKRPRGTRYLVNLAHLTGVLLRKRIDLAVDAGADGVGLVKRRAPALVVGGVGNVDDSS